MKTHKWLRHVGARGIVILALALASLGAVAAASSGHSHPINSGDFISTPWMY